MRVRKQTVSHLLGTKERAGKKEQILLLRSSLFPLSQV